MLIFDFIHANQNPAQLPTAKSWVKLLFPFNTCLLLFLFLLAPGAEAGSEPVIHELPKSLVERVEYLGHGAFKVTLTAAKSLSPGKPKLFFDGSERLAFVFEPDTLDGTLVEISGTAPMSMRTDTKLKGAAFVTLLIATASERGEVDLACAFVQKDDARSGPDTYRLIYFQVLGK